MAVVLLETDAFGENFSSVFHDRATQNRNEGWDYGKWWHTIGKDVRRPTSGLVLKQDTVAGLLVQDAKGNTQPLYSSGNLGADGKPKEGRLWTDFTLQQVVESRSEKMQMVETFGEDYVFFYGERPRVLQCSGVLVNTEDFNWRAEFWWNYDRYLRGSKLVESNSIAYLTWEDVIVQGYLFNANAVDSAQNPHQIPFSFSMLVHRSENVGMLYHTVDQQALVRTGLLAGLVALNEQGGIQQLGAEARYHARGASKIARDGLKAQLVELLTDTYGSKAEEQAEAILSADSLSTLNTRIKNLQSKSGLSFWDALKEYLLDPAKLFNLARVVARGDIASVAAGLGYGVFNAATTQVPLLGALDPLATGAVGLAKLSDAGVDIGDQARGLFDAGAFASIGVTAGTGLLRSGVGVADVPASL